MGRKKLEKKNISRILKLLVFYCFFFNLFLLFRKLLILVIVKPHSNDVPVIIHGIIFCRLVELTVMLFKLIFFYTVMFKNLICFVVDI